MELLDGNRVKLECSGRVLYAYAHKMCPDGERGLLQGFDGNVAEAGDLTPEERREIADHFIALWRAWARADDSEAAELKFQVEVCWACAAAEGKRVAGTYHGIGLVEDPTLSPDSPGVIIPHHPDCRKLRARSK